jgi:hypothetical protein
MKKRREGDRRTPSWKPSLHGGGAVAAGAAAAAAGAAVGAVAGPPGIVIGAVIGGAAGAATESLLERARRVAQAHERQLDEDVGITSGDIGAPNLNHPPPQIGAYSAASSGAGTVRQRAPAEGPMSSPPDEEEEEEEE